ncbi:Uncharacterized membrane protein, DUF485 family [Streptomyces sp. Amel2xC10]|nr:DUF485 domain-containing protein [Streptomyces sp. Amel2xC10]SMF78918.1 Uncharacterized membrane protein, DUF485 family [Streptomyces sp. Amel2xC10]
MTDAFPPGEHRPRHPAPPYGPESPSCATHHPGQDHPQPRPGLDPWRATAPGPHSDLRTLRDAYRRQRRVATLTALGYFTLFLVLSAFLPSLMTATVSDGLSVGLLLGLLQVPVTCLSIGLYEYTARQGVDPIANRMRRQAVAGTERRV